MFIDWSLFKRNVDRVYTTLFFHYLIHLCVKKMSYRFVYPNGCYDYRRSYSPESFSSESESSDDYEYRGRTMTRETRQPRDMIRAPPPIIKRVVKRTPTPVMEPPPSRSVQKEMNEEHSSPIVRTR